MSDLLGEALARWEGWQQGDPFDPGTLDQLLAAARNWHTLTTGDREMVRRLRRALREHGIEDGLRAAVDALTDTADE